MSDIQQIVNNESLDDIVTVFALIKAQPHLDMMICRYKPEAIPRCQVSCRLSGFS
ncbi:hypothetical protein D9M70_651500 [compost metagenome]